jgi:hypothetical protein
VGLIGVGGRGRLARRGTASGSASLGIAERLKVQVEIRSKITVIAVVALATGLLLGACGGEDEGGGGEPVTDSPVPSTGVAAEGPEKVAKCLSRRGFEVEDEDEDDLGGEEGAEARLSLGGPAEVPGSGRITYYETEERAHEANAEELAGQPLNSLIGRTGEAVYVFASAEDLEPARQAILGCL